MDAVKRAILRVIIYARVSTDEQAEKGYSLPTQLAACRKYAEENGFVVIVEITDDCSGATLDRPGLDQLRAMLARKEADAVIVYDPDRLSRDDVDFLIICREWERAGITLHFVNGGELPNTPEGDIVRYLMGWKGKRERKTILERTLRGKRAKAQAGKWVGACPKPYGFKREGKGQEARLVIDEYESAVLQQILTWYAGVDGRALSLREIIERLTANGTPSPKAGRGWHVETVKRLIDRRAYIGEFKYDGQIIYLPELAVIDRELWEAAQARRKKNKDLAKRNRIHEYLLAGHIKCKCEGAIVGNASRFHYKGKTYLSLRYVCPFQYRAERRLLRPCDEKPFSTTEADTMVWNWLAGLLEDDEKIDKGLREMQERTEAQLEPKRRRLEIVNELIEKAERKIKRLVSAFANDEDADEIAVAAVQAEVKTTSKQRDSLIAERDVLVTELTQGEITDADREAIKAKAREVRKRLAHATYDEKRSLFDALDVRVQLRDDNTERWLDCTCGLKLTPTPLPLCVTDLTRTVTQSARVVIFSASLPLEAQRVMSRAPKVRLTGTPVPVMAAAA